MKTYKLTTEKEIREMLEQALKVTDAKDYCQRLACFFDQKLEDIIDLFVTRELYGKDSQDAERKEDEIRNAYGIYGCNAFDLREALEDGKTAMEHYERLDSIVNRIVKAELQNPTSVEIEDFDDEDEIAEARLEIDTNFYGAYCSDIMPSNVCELYNHSYGISKWFETELSEFLTLHDLK